VRIALDLEQVEDRALQRRDAVQQFQDVLHAEAVGHEHGVFFQVRLGHVLQHVRGLSGAQHIDGRVHGDAGQPSLERLFEHGILGVHLESANFPESLHKALVHDLLVKLGGGEKVLECLMNMYPEADVFPLIYDEKKVGSVFPKEKNKFLPTVPKWIYRIFGNQRFTLPFLPRAVESIDLTGYDVVIVSNTAFAHGIITKPETKTIIYYHSPVRYLWDRTFEYRREIGWGTGIKSWILSRIFEKLRMWDYIASQRHDITLANSENVAKRIKKYYGLDAKVIYPNVDTKRFARKVSISLELPAKKYYIIISALTEFKKVHL